MARPASPILTGSLFAVFAALSFGVTTPVVAVAGRDAGPFATAALLYAGAFLSSVLLALTRRSAGAPAARISLARVGLVAFFGAAVAPSLLAWGIQHAGGTTGSLLLNLEAVFTALLARAIYRESMGRRVVVALSLMVAAGVVLTISAATTARWSALGALAVGGASLAWALDNVLTRPLAERDPLLVVMAKSSLGAALTAAVAFAVHERLPAMTHTVALLLCGATGYGFSLRLYLLAQRRIGAARTASIFALAPFVGAALSWLVGAQPANALTALAAGLFGVGVYLHLTERHGHRHLHQQLEHEHAHRHDDGHHDHVHERAVAGEHTHPHRHDAIEHDHEHGPDVHHGHGH